MGRGLGASVSELPWSSKALQGCRMKAAIGWGQTHGLLSHSPVEQVWDEGGPRDWCWKLWARGPRGTPSSLALPLVPEPGPT